MATPPLLKRLNEETVLESIRTGAPISRAEIARRAGISKPTVSLALRTLLDAGLVREAAAGPAGPTYGAVYFEPVAEAALVLGVDLGARFLRGALADLTGATRARQDVEVAGPDAESALEAIVGLRGAAGGPGWVGVGLEQEIAPCAAAFSGLASRLADGRETILAAPFDPPAIFAAARDGDIVGREVVREEARRIALHIAAIAAV